MRKGLTLMEVIVAMAILTVLLATVPQVYARTIKNIGQNGNDINTINSAKTELNVAISNPTYTGNNTTPTVTQEKVTVKVLGTDVNVRYIKSAIGELTFGDPESSFFMYVPESLALSGGGGDVIDEVDDELVLDSMIFMDKNKDGLFTAGVDENVVLNDTNGHYTYNGEGNLVIGESYTVNYPIKIDVTDKVLIGKDVYFGGRGASQVDCGALVLKEGSTFRSENGSIKIVATEKIELGKNATISNANGNFEINTTGNLLLGEGAKIKSESGSLPIECADLILGKGAEIYAVNNSLSIVATGNIKLEENSKISCDSQSLPITCVDLELNNNSTIYAKNRAVNITASGNISLDNGSKLQSDSNSVKIEECENISLNNNSFIKSQNNPIEINASRDFRSDNGSYLDTNNAININSGNAIAIQGGSRMYAQNGAITLKAHEAYVSGTSEKTTTFDGGGNGTIFDIDASGKIYYGQSGATSAYVTFSRGTKNGYAYNKNNTPFDSGYVTPNRDSSDQRYFK